MSVSFDAVCPPTLLALKSLQGQRTKFETARVTQKKKSTMLMVAREVHTFMQVAASS